MLLLLAHLAHAHPTVEIEVSGDTVGSLLELTVTDAVPGETVHFLRDTTAGPGPCHPVDVTACTGLVAPMVAASTVADAFGNATVGAVPPFGAGQSMCFQGAVLRPGTAALSAVQCTTYGIDSDGDGAGGLDCMDGDPSVYPGATEVVNGIDDDCDGAVDEHGDSSLLFDGIDDLVTIGADPALDIADAITMEAWVYANNPNADQPVLAKEGGLLHLQNLQYWFGVHSGRFGLLLADDLGETWALIERASGSITAGTWVHIASTWDGANWANYQDGVLVGSGAYSATLPAFPHPLMIGSNSGAGTTFFDGHMTDVRLWSVARTPQQIADQRTTLTDTTGLVGRWMLDEGAGQRVRDATGNGHTGWLGDTTDTGPDDPAWSPVLPSL